MRLNQRPLIARQSKKALWRASEEARTYIVILDSVNTHFKMLKECLGKQFVKSHTPEDIKPNIVDFSVKGSLTGYSGKFTKSFVEDYLSKMEWFERILNLNWVKFLPS